jgi:hypothetical protein
MAKRRAAKRGRGATKKRRVAAKPARPKRRKRRAPAPKRRAPAKRARRAVRATQVAAPAASGLRAKVIEALRRRGFDPADGAVIDVVTAVGAGYRLGPAEAPVALASTADGAVADAFAEFYRVGARTNDIDRQPHRHTVRATVDMDLAQLGPAGTGETERDALTAVALGIWRPGLDEVAKLDALAGFVGRFYRAGLA